MLTTASLAPLGDYNVNMHRLLLSPTFASCPDVQRKGMLLSFATISSRQTAKVSMSSGSCSSLPDASVQVDSYPKATKFAGRPVKESSLAELQEHFPVPLRVGHFDEHINVVSDSTIAQFLGIEYSLKRLEDRQEHLWRVGYPRPPRSLSTQIQWDDQSWPPNALDMHLVWGWGSICLKPLPRYLLEPEVWTTQMTRNDATVRKSALGLLYTYACLIVTPADLAMAMKHNLIPKDAAQELEWPAWRALATEVLDSDIYCRRFRRAELRVDRLNSIYVFKDMPKFQSTSIPGKTTPSLSPPTFPGSSPLPSTSPRLDRDAGGPFDREIPCSKALATASPSS